MFWLLFLELLYLKIHSKVWNSWTFALNTFSCLDFTGDPSMNWNALEFATRAIKNLSKMKNFPPFSCKIAAEHEYCWLFICYEYSLTTFATVRCFIRSGRFCLIISIQRISIQVPRILGFVQWNFNYEPLSCTNCDWDKHVTSDILIFCLLCNQHVSLEAFNLNLMSIAKPCPYKLQMI